MISFIGAGPGDPELLTIKGKRLIDEADVIIYAGSLVNPDVLSGRKETAIVHDSAYMHLDQVIEVMEQAEKEGKKPRTDECAEGGKQELRDAYGKLTENLARRAVHRINVGLIFLAVVLMLLLVREYPDRHQAILPMTLKYSNIEIVYSE